MIAALKDFHVPITIFPLQLKQIFRKSRVHRQQFW